MSSMSVEIMMTPIIDHIKTPENREKNQQREVMTASA